MASYLILFGTTEGQTAKIAAHIAATFTEHGHSVTLLDSAAMPHDFTLETYDVALIGASLHAGGYQRTIREFVKHHAAKLLEMPSAFFSLSLTEAYPTLAERHQLDCHLQRFFDETGWHPTHVASFAGALVYSHYHGLKLWMMRRIGREVHAPTDISHDYEYTDWAAVTHFAEDMLAIPKMDTGTVAA